jgi:spore maturation protein CgeB
MTTTPRLSTVSNDARGACGVKKVAIVGALDGTHLGASLARAASRLSLETIVFDVADAAGGNRYLQALSWRFADRRPLHLGRFSAAIVDACKLAKPDILIATGIAPVTEQALCALRAQGVFCINFSADDPWNPVHLARWHLRALPAYDVVLTPRRANADDFHKLGCTDVRYLPFGYDDALFYPTEVGAEDSQHEILFVGGADRERLAFVKAFVSVGLPLALVGAYWERFSVTRPYALGLRLPESLRRLTAAAKVNLCLVRRANRDGHVMRSFEIAAIGGCMLAEDTEEHRAIFGSDGEAVYYFRTPAEAAVRVRSLMGDPAERARLAASARSRIAGGAHTYRDRLAVMIKIAADCRPKDKDRRILQVTPCGRFGQQGHIGFHNRFYWPGADRMSRA